MAKAVGGDRIRQPRVPVVHPPDHREHHDDLCERDSVSPLHQDRGQLGDREDEDEVEEELERGNAGRPVRLELGHARIIPRGSDPKGLTPSSAT